MDRADLPEQAGVAPRPSIVPAALENDIEAARDAVAAVLACMRGDGEGLVAVLNNTPRARPALGALAFITADLLLGSGIDEQAASRILTEARRKVDDALLDHLSPAGGR